MYAYKWLKYYMNTKKYIMVRPGNTIGNVSLARSICMTVMKTTKSVIKNIINSNLQI